MRDAGRKKRKVKRGLPMTARTRRMAESGAADRDEPEAKTPVLPAKPQEKPVDYATLRKKVMARFPRVLAHLAK